MTQYVWNVITIKGEESVLKSIDKHRDYFMSGIIGRHDFFWERKRCLKLVVERMVEFTQEDIVRRLSGRDEEEYVNPLSEICQQVSKYLHVYVSHWWCYSPLSNAKITEYDNGYVTSRKYQLTSDMIEGKEIEYGISQLSKSTREKLK